MDCKCMITYNEYPGESKSEPVFPYFLMMQLLFFDPYDHWALYGILEKLSSPSSKLEASAALQTTYEVAVKPRFRIISFLNVFVLKGNL